MRLSTKIVVAAILCFFAFPQFAPAQTAEQLIGKDVADFGKQYESVSAGVEAYQKGDINRARALFATAKMTHPQLPPGDVLLARMLSGSRKLKEAQAALNQAALQFPDDPEAFLLLADLQFAQGNVALASIAFEHGAALTKKYDRNKQRKIQLQIRSAAGLAAVAEKTSNWKTAERHFKEWVTLDAKNAAVLSRLAAVQFRLKQFGDAKNTLVNESALSGSKLPAEIKMAKLYDQAQQHVEAAGEIKTAVAQHSNNIDVLLAAAEIELRRGRQADAKKHIDAALKLNKTSLAAMTLAGQAARHRGDEEKAKEYLNYVAYRSPGNFTATNQLARLLAGSDDESEEQKSLQLAELNFRAYSDHNTQAGREAAVTMGWILFQRGQEVQGEAAIATAMRGGSITSESAYLGAVVLSKRGKKPLARAILEPILKADMHFPGDEEAAKLVSELKMAN